MVLCAVMGSDNESGDVWIFDIFRTSYLNKLQKKYLLERMKKMKEKILNLLEEVCEDDVVREDLDMDLFEEELMDSLAFAELLAMIEEELGVVISPSEVVRSQVNTANKIIALVEEKK